MATSKRGSAQASWIALTNTGRCNNSSGDGFAYDLILAGVRKQFAGGLQSFAH
jgi:hypothetical protein